MHHSLTPGSIRLIHNQDTSQSPVVQITDLKKIAPTNGTNQARYRLLISDGQFAQQAMLATQLNSLVTEEAISNMSLVRLTEYICNLVHNKTVVIILNLEVVSPPVEKIGNPVPIDQPGSNPAQTRPDFVRPPTNIPNPSSAFHMQQQQQQQQQRQQQQQQQQQLELQQDQNFSSSSLQQQNQGINLSHRNNNSPWNKTSTNNGPIAQMKPSYGAPQGSNFSNNIQYQPIASLSPFQNRWNIKARITYKGDLKKYQNARGEGVLFSFELTDASASIRATCFKETAETLYHLVQLGKVYTVSKGIIKQANPQYNQSSSPYELTLNHDTEIQEAPDDGSVATASYKFRKISELSDIEVGTFVDVVAVVKDVSDIRELVSKSTGQPVYKRSVTLIDDSGCTVDLTLWRENAQNLIASADGNPTLLAKAVKRGEYNGVTLDSAYNSSFSINPQIPEALKQKNWFQTAGNTSSNITSLSGTGTQMSRRDEERSLLMDNSKLDGLHNDPKGVYFNCRASPQHFRREGSMWYTACPETNKKVIEMQPGQWLCEATGKQFDHCNYRYITTLKIRDMSGSQWVQAFDETATIIIGKSAEEMNSLEKSGQKDVFDRILEDVYFKDLIFTVRAKNEEYQGENRIRYTIVKAAPVDYAHESKILIDTISRYNHNF